MEYKSTEGGWKMKLTPSPPDVDPNGWYNTSEAILKMGMTRTTFWRKAKAGVFKRRYRPVDGTFWYQGRELSRVWYMLR